MRIMQELPGMGEEAVLRIGGSDLCKVLGISPAKLTGLCQSGQAVRLGHDSYDLIETVRRYVEHLRGTASGRGGEEHIASLTSERARLAREQADAQSLKNAIIRRDHVPAADVERAWSELLRAVRSKILAVPSRTRSALPHLTLGDVAEIDRELRAALEDLAHADD